LFIFWRKRNGGGGWSEATFCLACLGCSSRFAFTLEKLYTKSKTGCAACVLTCKKCDRNKQQKGWNEWKGFKD
jgi:aldehyde:ferredoxin oxidoreductase